ncbi:DUF5994 family protein [Tsukamurella paurometabola]|uniref:Uncharacterized protein n=1 Tax=Tsukamurella paurometabola TaxID=2061 RepID=A0ABS5NEC4_TSUPA|nr:DUF5994 family protein [Tsukamurella paurometabola]MBS4102624.1 hypothetical protein [Tsukamurella paurometabola]
MSGDRATPAQLRGMLRRPPVPIGRPVPGRVLLRSPASLPHHIAGVWWPRSRRLAHELPTVIPTIGLRLNALTRVGYSTIDWTPLEPRVDVKGDLVEFDAGHPPGLILFTGPNASFAFGLIAPDTTQQQAERRTAALLHDR